MNCADPVTLGRPWAIQELREKSWEDLHKLWWVCVKERNRIATTNLERERLKAGFGAHEANERDRVVSLLPVCLSIARYTCFWFAGEIHQRVRCFPCRMVTLESNFPRAICSGNVLTFHSSTRFKSLRRASSTFCVSAGTPGKTLSMSTSPRTIAHSMRMRWRRSPWRASPRSLKGGRGVTLSNLVA